MKKITLVLLALCLAATLVFSVACTGGSDDTTVEGGDGTTPDGTQGGEVIPETADPEDEGFISVEPIDGEEQWSDLVTSAD